MFGKKKEKTVEIDTARRFVTPSVGEFAGLSVRAIVTSVIFALCVLGTDTALTWMIGKIV